MEHAKTMLGLMEPEQLAPYGYEVPDSRGVRDKLDTSANTTIGMIDRSRKVSGVMTAWMFAIASGHAPVRAAASSIMGIPTTHVVPPLST
eukprot:1253757-Amphidinium_carterae.1